jgi:hypothetical protein
VASSSVVVVIVVVVDMINCLVDFVSQRRCCQTICRSIDRSIDIFWYSMTVLVYQIAILCDLVKQQRLWKGAE